MIKMVIGVVSVSVFVLLGQIVTVQSREAESVSGQFETLLGDGSPIIIEARWLETPRIRQATTDSAPKDKMFLLNYLIVRRPNTNDGIPVIYLAGGPGSAASDMLHNSQIAPTFARIIEKHPLILFDQRGTGRSWPKPECARLTLSLPLIPAPGQQERLTAIRRLSDVYYADIRAQGFSMDELRH